MKKIAFSLVLISALNATEFRFGHGDMSFTGGFLGFNQTVTEGIDVFSIEENHKNILGSKVFYAYNLTWYDSEHFKQMQSTYNSTVSSMYDYMPIKQTQIFIPTMDYRLQGFDASLSLGYDIYNEDENNYVGIGGYLGINLPWIDSKKDSLYLKELPAGVDTKTLYEYYKASKTDIKTYKIGLSFYGRRSLAPGFSAYLNAVYAYQTASIENDYAKTDLDVDGTYKSMDIGIRFQPYEKDHKFLGITWSPRVFVTVGYKLERWSVDDVAIDISGMGLSMPKTTMKFDTDIGYLGVGYSF